MKKDKKQVSTGEVVVTFVGIIAFVYFVADIELNESSQKSSQKITREKAYKNAISELCSFYKASYNCMKNNISDKNSIKCELENIDKREHLMNKTDDLKKILTWKQRENLVSHINKLQRGLSVMGEKINICRNNKTCAISVLNSGINSLNQGICNSKSEKSEDRQIARINAQKTNTSK